MMWKTENTAVRNQLWRTSYASGEYVDIIEVTISADIKTSFVLKQILEQAHNDRLA